MGCLTKASLALTMRPPITDTALHDLEPILVDLKPTLVEGGMLRKGLMYKGYQL
ncbi:MAG: hypothetical protein CM15mV74_020 [uncultured marine virus]|nr:MAG: hypothetical protein CM15mV74_020 [uncultured marine virus]